MAMKSACLVTIFALVIPGAAIAQEKKPVSEKTINQLMQTWDKEVKARVSKDKALKPLVAKHHLVILHSASKYSAGDASQSGYSFVQETALIKVHERFTDLIFHTEAGPPTFRCTSCLVVKLGMVDFEKNLDLSKISIEHPGIVIDNDPAAIEGHVYLQRIRYGPDNDFFVLIRVVAVDKDARYMAFVWRMLPGGKRNVPEPIPQ
jgi:hypothetical protein